jgi:drug/metabolite transporter (DMT)-like permease
LSAVLLALAASLAWGFGDFGAGYAARRLHVLVVATTVQAAGLVFALAIVLLGRDAAPSAQQLGWAAVAGVVSVVGLSAFYQALAVGAMGIVGPITATAAVIPVVYGLVRGERPSTVQGIGVALAVAGVAVASLEPLPEGRGRRLAAGVGFAIVAALAFGCALIGLSRAASGGAPWAVLMMRLAAVPALLLVVALVRKATAPRLARLWLLLAAAGVADTGATVLFGEATTRGLLSVVAVLASLYPIVLVVLARLLLHERVARPQLGGVALALMGVALISAG